MMLTAVMVAHLLMFAAFLCLAMDRTAAVYATAAAAMLLLLSMPPLRASAAAGAAVCGGVSVWSGRIAMVLMLMWLMGMPEIHHLLDRMISDRMLLDAKVVTAVVLWMFGSAITQWCAIRGLSDRRIYDWLEGGGPCGQGST